MRKLLFFGGGAIVVLAGLVVAALYFLFGITKTAEIREGVFQVYNENMLGRIGANMTIFETERGFVSIDAHLAPLVSAARKKIAHRSNKPVLAVFNTHWHPDHSGGNEKLTVEADIIAHENVRSTLRQDQQGFGLTKPGSTHDFKAIAEMALPEILVHDATTFTQYGAEFRAVHYSNAHTDGDLVIFAPQYQIVALGDLVWPRAFPFVDVHNGGTAQGIHDALSDIAQSTNGDYRFVTGHGAPITHADLVEYIDMVAASIEHVKKEKSNRKTLAAIQETGLPVKWNNWESKLVPATEWIKMIYETD